MQIKIERPDPDYPIVWVHVPLTTNVDHSGIAHILEEKRITLLGRWGTHIEKGSATGFKAPALLEDEHKKPTKRRGPYKRSAKK
ncbi:hypothetical protein [Streptomyces phage Psst1]|nr:hypothetical protein [Streptomyces phage Psst1]WPJ30734.1 hypothetical protein [Streptomyces phage Psst2]